MITFAAAIVTLVGVVLLVNFVRADLAVRRWVHTTGTVVAAHYGWLRDDGREVWHADVSYRPASGLPVTARVPGQFGKDLADRVGQPIEVWYDPRDDSRVHAHFNRRAATTAWWMYALPLVLIVVGVVVLVAALT
jgi:hypothetical protein